MKQQLKEEEKSSYTAPVASVPVALEPEATTVAVRAHDPIPNFRRSAVTLKSRLRQFLQRGFMRLKGQRLSKKGALVLLSGALLFGGRWYWANQAPVIPYPPRVETAQTGRSAGPFFMAAVDALPVEMTGYPYSQSQSLGGPDVDTREQRVEAVTKLAPSLKLIREGLPYQYEGPKTRFWKGQPFRSGMEAPVMNFIAMRTLGRGLADEARLKEEAGDFVGALGASLDAAQLGTEISHGSDSLVQPMIGELVLGIGISEATRNVAKLTPEQAQNALARLQKIRARRTTREEMWQGEMRQNRSLLGQLFQDPSGTLPLMAFSSSSQTAIPSYFAELMRYGKQGLVDQVMGYQNSVLEKFRLPYQQAKRVDLAPAESDLVQLMTPNTRRVERGYAERSVKLALLQAALMRQAKSGLKLPADAFSETGLEPLHSDTKTGKVWSVGPNGVDEHGGGDDISGS
ncbi:MAG: hypothetical protein NTX57_07035 [Armatimonadetes bacterium]|nr:hypothetical protein [Armatimonadota bacterium]